MRRRTKDGVRTSTNDGVRTEHQHNEISRTMRSFVRARCCIALTVNRGTASLDWPVARTQRTPCAASVVRSSAGVAESSRGRSETWLC